MKNQTVKGATTRLVSRTVQQGRDSRIATKNQTSKGQPQLSIIPEPFNFLKERASRAGARQSWKGGRRKSVSYLNFIIKFSPKSTSSHQVHTSISLSFIRCNNSNLSSINSSFKEICNDLFNHVCFSSIQIRSTTNNQSLEND